MNFIINNYYVYILRKYKNKIKLIIKKYKYLKLIIFQEKLI